MKPNNILLSKIIDFDGLQKTGEFRRVKSSLTGAEICSMMRENNKTISEISTAWNITQKRVRYVREHGVTGLCFVMDWIQFTTGCTFTRTNSGDWIIVSSNIS